MIDTTRRARPAKRRADLDPAGCDMPDCGHDHSVLFLVARCHMRAGVDASYHKKDGTIRLACHQCNAPVASLEVAP